MLILNRVRDHSGIPCSGKSSAVCQASRSLAHADEISVCPLVVYAVTVFVLKILVSIA